jgi:hypothetical protein
MRLPLPSFRARLGRLLLVNLAVLAGAVTVPHWWCAWQANPWLRNDPTIEAQLANGVAGWVEGDLARNAFQTGDAQFDGEWLFGTYLMAGLGFGQSALRHPEKKAEYGRLMDECIAQLLTPEVRAFDRRMWGNDPIESLDGSDHHAAYLGYFNLLLGLHRAVDSASRHAALNDRITAALIRRLGASPLHLLESYPREVYPVDNCAVIGSIGQHARVSGEDHTTLLQDWAARCRERWIDPKTGLLIQAINPMDGTPADLPRGSGTALGLYFLSFADPVLSRDLYDATRRELFGHFLGFGGVREYARSVRGESGDIDCGPIVFGFGLSPTGFLIGGTRLHRDDATLCDLYATAHLCGAPVIRKGRLNFVTGGPLGDAILFAMLTAAPVGEGRP